MKKSCLVIGGSILGFLLLVGVCSRVMNGDAKKAIPSPTVSTEYPKGSMVQQEPDTDLPAAKPEETGKWVLDETVDKMTSKKVRYAHLEANNTVKLDFPYGEVSARLTLRQKGGSTDVMFSVDKGQIQHNSDGAKIRARFDEAQPKTYSCDMPSDNSTETVFIRNTGDFIKRLKASKHLILEVEFYSNGNQIIEFDIEHLKW